MSHILVFSPYAMRPHLMAYEGTIAKGCEIRGADVQFLLCDGLLPECDMHWDSFVGNYPRPFDICRQCQVGAKTQMAEFDLQYKWIGAYVTGAERERAFHWAQELSPSEMNQASFMEYRLGEWVQSSLLSYFRQYPLDMSNWHVVNVYRGFLFAAAIVSIGLNKYLDLYTVDSALLFNGRQSITRVAFEIFQKRGIRVLTHESPFYQRGHIMLKPNARCWGLQPFNDFWSRWRSVPLTRSSLELTLTWLIKRRYGQGLSWYAFNKPYLHDQSIRNTLKMKHDKRLIALFTSSMDETAGDSELQGPYELQTAWVQDVIQWARNKEDIQLVIRVHPHLAGKTGLARANDEYNYYDKMQSLLPDHIRIVMPDAPLNSYALMDEADLGLTFGSSVGIEMAMLGKPVLLAARAFYEDCPMIITVRSKESLPELLERALQFKSSREIRRQAFRIAYYYVFKFELPFPLVTPFGVMDVKLNYGGSEQLVHGKDDTLDKICNYLIRGDAIFSSPSDIELARTIWEEDEFFDAIENRDGYLRDRKIERRLQVINLLKWAKQSTRKVLGHSPIGRNMLMKAGRDTYRSILHWIEQR
jgi:hypothetical protein